MAVRASPTAITPITATDRGFRRTNLGVTSSSPSADTDDFEAWDEGNSAVKMAPSNDYMTSRNP
jgi:hypothetical protein